MPSKLEEPQRKMIPTKAPMTYQWYANLSWNPTDVDPKKNGFKGHRKLMAKSGLESVRRTAQLFTKSDGPE